jgi:hypothetical protein
MSCAAFDVLAGRLARNEDLPGAMREEALAHARGCATCAARLEDESAVTAALSALAARTARAEAPAAVEWAVRRGFRETLATGQRLRRRAGPLHSAKVALLAAAAVVAVLAVVPRGAPRAASVLPAGTTGAPIDRGTAAGFGTEFVSLGYGEDLRELDSFQIVQVQVARTALTALGWPAGETEAGAVTAEVIVGHDGVARAIRLVE